MDDIEVTPASGAWRKHSLITGKRYKKNFITFERLLDRSIDNITTSALSNVSNQIIITDTSSKRDVCRVVKVTKDSNKDSVKPYSLSVIKEFIQEASFKSVSWYNDSMVVGSTDGQIYYYNNDPTSSSDDPELRETYTITKLKGNKEVSQTIGSQAQSTTIKHVSINELASNTFSSLENNYFHIWDFADAVRPTISFKVSDQSVDCMQWSPHSRHFSLLGGSDLSLRITDTRIMSSYNSVKKSPIVWSNIKSSSSSSSSPLSNQSSSSSYSSSLHDSIKDVAWHPFVPYWFASASSSGSISIYDLRSTLEPVIKFNAHNSSISKIQWCPGHSELMVSSSIDGEYKMWSLLNEPHYNLFQKDEVSPFVYSGFFENDGYNNIGVNQSGELYYANISPKFMNPIIHSKFSKKEKLEKVTERLIYHRDFTTGFENAIQLANKHSRLKNLEKAKNLLSLCFQQNIDDGLSDVLKMVQQQPPKTSCRNQTIKDIKSYAYNIPPGYYEKYGTKLSTALMTKIKELKVNLDIQYSIKNFSGEEIVDIEREILNTLKTDHTSIRLETIVELVTVLLNYDPVKCYQFALQLIEVFKSKLNICLPILRLLVSPSIFEKRTNPLNRSTIINDTVPIPSSQQSPTVQSRKDTGIKSQTSSISSSPVMLNRSGGLSNSGNQLRDSSGSISYNSGDIEETRLNDYFSNYEFMVQQLTFLRDFIKILLSPTPISDGSNPNVEDIIDFASKNRPSPILSMSVNRIYLSILSDMFIFDQLYIVLLNLMETLGEDYELYPLLDEIYQLQTPDFISFLKNSQMPDRLKPYDTERFSTPLLIVISIIYNVPPQAIPIELNEILLSCLPVLIEEIDNSLISTIQQPDPSNTQPGKLQSSSKAKNILDLVKTITEAKKSSSLNSPMTERNRNSTNLTKLTSTTSSPSPPSQSLSPVFKVSTQIQSLIQNLNTVLNKYIY
ncbi:hypothetical protein CYY_009650 [Polysphondylium violaceum]|uniref:WD40 repeat-containing protein n=1 Tax=Polysphondylium violaceum TaxID=133409 RepID=A0A8J4V2R0_9MYCE|nr:hypothetical protein CYY_009650 [Polysphondylium violaceum]